MWRYADKQKGCDRNLPAECFIVENKYMWINATGRFPFNLL